jgi:hypothetical protein
MKVKFYLDDEDALNSLESVPLRNLKKFKKKIDDDFSALKMQKKQKEKFSRSTLRKHHGL